MHRAMEMRVHKGSGIVTCRQMLTMKNIENILMMSRTANHLLPLSLRVSTTYTVIQGVPSLVESGNDQFLEGGKRKTSTFWCRNRNSVYERKQNLGKLQVGNRKQTHKTPKMKRESGNGHPGKPPR